MNKPIRWVVCLITILMILAACATPPAPTATPQPAAPVATAKPEPTKAPVAQPTAPAATTKPEPTKATTGAATAVPTVNRAADPKFGGRLRASTGALIQFDEVLSSDGPSQQAMSSIHGYLFRRQDFGDPIPDLAESWEWTDDTTLVFRLRRGVMFHDGNEIFPEGKGREVVADDVVFSMERWLTMKGTKVTSDITDTYDSMTAVDKYTVRLKLKKPAGDLFNQVRGLSKLAIIPKEAADKYGEDFGKKPVGAGPFKFVEYVPDDHLLLRRNEDYWLPCYLDEVYYKVIPDTNVALIALEAGDVDFISGVPGAQVNRIAADQRFNQYYLPSKTPRMIMFPTGVKDFQDKKFRQAIAWAIDSQKIGPSVYGAVAETGCGNASKGVPGSVPDLCQKYFTYNPDGAKKLFAELGWTDSNGDGILDKNGVRMEEIKINTFNTASMPAVIEIVVTQLKAVGVPAVAEVVEFGTWSNAYISGAKNSQANQRKLMLWAGCGGPGGFAQCWARTASFPSVFGFVDEEVFTLIEQANSTPDVKKQDALLQKATEKVFGDYWVINATGPIGALQASQKYVKEYGSVYRFDNICTAKNNVWLDKKK
jgi:peptide/nickel transport system substrate-binding protein